MPELRNFCIVRTVCMQCLAICEKLKDSWMHFWTKWNSNSMSIPFNLTTFFLQVAQKKRSNNQSNNVYLIHILEEKGQRHINIEDTMMISLGWKSLHLIATFKIVQVMIEIKQSHVNHRRCIGFCQIATTIKTLQLQAYSPKKEVIKLPLELWLCSPVLTSCQSSETGGDLPETWPEENKRMAHSASYNHQLKVQE
jgi:hypothetical protein